MAGKSHNNVNLIFSIYVADNIDLNEEILFGMNQTNLLLTLATRSKPFPGKTTPWTKK